MKKLNKKLICVTIGDIEGIGIYLLIKEFLKNNIQNFVIISNIEIFNKNIKFPKNKINTINKNIIENFDSKKLNIYTFKTKNKNTNTIRSLELSLQLTKKKIFTGILTLPLNKNKINMTVDKKFLDQTTFFSKHDNSKNSNMIFYYKSKFFVPLTIHIELKKVHLYFKNYSQIINKIESLSSTLKKDFKVKNAKMIMAGINPHAGENGTISNDDETYLNPIIRKLKNRKINITGPVSGDSIINEENLKRYDVFLFTFHDQALIPFKIISNYEGVNFTSGLNVIRVSPSHGTAENLIGNNQASTKGILNCFNLINSINKNRN